MNKKQTTQQAPQPTPRTRATKPQAERPASAKTQSSKPLEKAVQARLNNPERVKAQRQARKSRRQPISRNETYPLDEFLQRTGMTESRYLEERMSGLEVTKIGDTHWITGEEWFRHVASKQSSGKIR